MKICVLNDPSWEEPFNPEIYLKNHTCEKVDVFYKSSYETLKKIYHKYDLFLNFCDASVIEKRPGIDVCLSLEKLQVPFTGAYSFCFEPSRNKMNGVCRTYGINMPKAQTLCDLSKLDQNLVGHLSYPMIVKHSNSFGSIGLIKDSKVKNFDELYEQCRRMLSMYKCIRIEEFVEGKEFSCLVSQNPTTLNDPIAYSPLEIYFPDGECFKHSDLKWVEHQKVKSKTVEDANISNQIKEICKKLFIGVNGRGYARCDLRMNDQNKVFMLEINFQAGILYPPEDPGTADIILQSEEGGHDKFMNLLIKSAFVNTSLRNKIL
jgi:D-alanine-D-alanine ligase